MLLNEENYSCNEYGYKRFYLPGGSIPKWFEHISGYSFSFWFRNKLPSISVCVVWTSDRFGYANACIKAEVHINGKAINSIVLEDVYNFTHPEDHITIVYEGWYHRRVYGLIPKDDSENEWNHVVIMVRRVEWHMKGLGIHVHKHESNMEDIRFTDPLLREKEVNMGDFHRDTEQEKNLTMLASVETQQGKGLSLHLPQAMNSLNDNVNGDLNSGSDNDSWKRDKELLSLRPCWEEPLDCENLESNLMQLASTSDTIKDQGSADLSKDEGKNLMVYNHSSEENSMHSCGQELFHKDWGSNSMKLASTSDNIREGSDHDSWKHNKELLSLLPYWEEPLDYMKLESNLMQLASTSDTIKDQGSDDDPWKRNKELLSLRPCWEEPLDCENLESNLMQLASTSDTIKDQGCGEPSRKRKRSASMLDLNTEPISEVDLDSDSVMARLASDDTNGGGVFGSHFIKWNS